MSIIACRNCGRQVNTDVIRKGEACPGCFNPLPVPPVNKIAAGAFIVALVAAVIWGQPNPVPSSSDAAAVAAQVAPPLSAAEHLALAKSGLDEGHSMDSPFLRLKRMTEIREHLASIPAGAPEFSEVAPLLREVDRRLQEIVPAVAIKEREQFASNFERHLLAQGFDMYVSAQGKDKTTLKIKFILMSRPTVYQVTNDRATLDTLRRHGFKRVIFTDGDDSTWIVDL